MVPKTKILSARRDFYFHPRARGRDSLGNLVGWDRGEQSPAVNRKLKVASSPCSILSFFGTLFALMSQCAMEAAMQDTTAGIAPKLSELEQDIIAVVGRSALPVWVIVSRLGHSNHAYIRTILAQMVEDGLLVKSPYGYCLP
jgi:hypothetical protein